MANNRLGKSAEEALSVLIGSPPKSNRAAMEISVMAELDREYREKEKLIQEIKRMSKPRIAGRRRRGVDLTRYGKRLESLTHRQRECFARKFGDGQSDTQIAKDLGLHHSTVQEHIKAAKKKIDKVRRRH